MDELIDRFYAAFESDPARLFIPRRNDIPPEMLSGVPADNPWVGWKVVPGRVSRSAWKQWQESRGFHLPEPWVKFFLARHTLALDCGILRLACSPSNQPFVDLEELLEWDIPLFRTHQLFPIGDEGLYDAGPLCLDLRKKNTDPPVVFWNAEREEVSPAVFSSVGKMLEGTALALEQGIESEETLAAFLALDPEGAGGPGAAYWRLEE